MDDLSQEVTLIIAATVFLFSVAAGIVNLVLLYQKKQLKYQREKEQLVTRFQKEILETKLEIQEQTLRAVSEEVHDNIGQVLSLAKLNLNTLVAPLPHADATKIDDARNLVGRAIEDLRQISRSLSGQSIHAVGLVAALQRELQQLERASGLQTRLQMQGPDPVLEPDKELVLYRIVQEALQNIVKHAQASQVTLSLHTSPGILHLSITDNGKGFKTGDITLLGNGLHNMRNRARLIGGQLLLQGSPGHGTTIDIHLPQEPGTA